MIKIETIFMPYVEYSIKDHKKFKTKIQKTLKNSLRGNCKRRYAY